MPGVKHEREGECEEGWMGRTRLMMARNDGIRNKRRNDKVEKMGKVTREQERGQEERVNKKTHEYEKKTTLPGAACSMLLMASCCSWTPATASPLD